MVDAGRVDASIPEDAFSIILNSTVCRALAYFDFALQTGESGLVQSARNLLMRGLQVASNAGAVSLWWIIRLCKSLIDDLWQHSLHENLPLNAPQGGEANYAALRQLFGFCLRSGRWRSLTTALENLMCPVASWPQYLMHFGSH